MKGAVFWLSIVSFVYTVMAWNEWDYKTTWSPTASEVEGKKLSWQAVWDAEGTLYNGNGDPPRPRRGHSLHIIQTDERSEYNGATYLVLFGGRDNDQRAVHIPKTYNVESVQHTNSSIHGL